MFAPKKETRSGLGQKPLPHEVITEPTTIREENLKALAIVEIDNRQIVLNSTINKSTIFVWLALMLTPVIATILFSSNPFGNWTTIIAMSILVALGGVGIIYLFSQPKKLLIFDRETGTVTLPPKLWGKHEVVPFKELYACLADFASQPAIVHYNLVAVRRDGHAIDISLSNTLDKENVYRDWSFYVWYMDKNRPLPPSPVFNKYRQKNIGAANHSETLTA